MPETIDEGPFSWIEVIQRFSNVFLLLRMNYEEMKELVIHQIHRVLQELSLNFMMRPAELVIALILITPVLSLKHFRLKKMKIMEL